MKLLVIFVASLLCVHAHTHRLPKLDSVSSASSEEIQYGLTGGNPPPVLPLPQIDSVSSASSEEILNNPSAGRPPPVLPLPQSDSVSSASSEEILYINTGGKQQPTLTGVGVVTQPILQAVKVTEPLNSNVFDNNLALAQILAAQDVNEQNFEGLDGKADDRNPQETNAGERLPIWKP